MFISTTRINDGSNIIFNVNDTPNVSIISAVAASMCIPFLSKPIIIDGYYYIDGFLTDNFPHEVFKGVHKDNILGVAVNIDSDYEITKIDKWYQSKFEKIVDIHGKIETYGKLDKLPITILK